MRFAEGQGHVLPGLFGKKSGTVSMKFWTVTIYRIWLGKLKGFASLNHNYAAVQSNKGDNGGDTKCILKRF